MTTSSAARKSHLRGVTTLIAVDRRARKPVYRQIYEAYRARILRNELRPNQVVPSSRDLARELGVSRAPVLNAYAQLLAEGYFESRVGSGTFIAGALPDNTPARARTRAAASTGRSRAVAALAAALPRFERASWAEVLGPFQVGQPDLLAFPLATWSRLVARCSRDMRVSALRHGSPLGSESLREAIAGYLRTSRGVVCEADQIMIVSGSQQGLDLAARVLLDPGAPVWIEEPGYWLVHHVMMMAGCRVVPVPVDMEGLNVRAGIERCVNARAAFVTPSHQYPLGMTMSAARRLQLLEWARTTGSWIIEDDYDSEYRYGSMPVSSLQGLDADARVIYVGTFSKVLFPSLRVGYIVIPPDLVERFAAVRQAMDLSPSQSSQAALSAFIREGHFARHIRRMRKAYGERRRVLVEALERDLGSCCRIVGDAAGMHVAMVANRDIGDRHIAVKAAERKLWLSALSLSYVGDAPRQGFVLGFGNTRACDIPQAVRLLRDLLRA